MFPDIIFKTAMLNTFKEIKDKMESFFRELETTEFINYKFYN